MKRLYTLCAMIFPIAMLTLSILALSAPSAPTPLPKIKRTRISPFVPATVEPTRIASQPMLASEHKGDTATRPAIPPVWLKTPKIVSRAELNHLIADLDHDEWPVREKASLALRKIGHQAIPLLRGAEVHPSLEVRRRARRLIDAFYSVSPSPHRDGTLRDYPSIYALCGELRHDPRRMRLAPGEALRTADGPFGIPGPVGSAAFASLEVVWDWSSWQNFYKRQETANPSQALALMAHGYFLRAAVPHRARNAKEQGNLALIRRGFWTIGSEFACKEATRLLVVDLLNVGVNPDWVQAMLDDMHCRNAFYPPSMNRPPPLLLHRAGILD